MTGRLHELGLFHRTDKATHHQYTTFYEEHLPERVGSLLEIGVMDGASLRVWRDHYPGAEIVGVDIVKRNPVEGCTVLHGDATDPEFIAEHLHREWDVIIDDGSHMTMDQQMTFVSLWPMVKKGGCYVLEDLHTSFIDSYVNSPLSTYDWLRIAVGLDVTFFSRTGKFDADDSVTSIIRKPS